MHILLDQQENFYIDVLKIILEWGIHYLTGNVILKRLQIIDFLYTYLQSRA